jgi:hypothetical protein
VGVLQMKQRHRIYYSETQKALMWERWRKGESLQKIAQLFDRNHSSVQGILAETGGIPPPQRHRSKLALTLAEREEISRALVADDSIQSIASRLSRAPSTICREIRRNSGPDGYRASHADQLAWDRARRPKACKLVEHRMLAHIVAGILQLQWLPQQIAGWLRRAYPDNEDCHVSHETIYRSLFITGPWCPEEGTAGAFAAHPGHAPVAPPHAEDERSRQDSRHGADQRTSSYS